MDIVDKASDVVEAFLDGARERFRRDAAMMLGGALLGPLCCRVCGEAVPELRRQAMPKAETCVDCQAGIERWVK